MRFSFGLPAVRVGVAGAMASPRPSGTASLFHAERVGNGEAVHRDERRMLLGELQRGIEVEAVAVEPLVLALRGDRLPGPFAVGAEALLVTGDGPQSASPVFDGEVEVTALFAVGREAGHDVAGGL